MKVKELKDKLKNIDDELNVWLEGCECYGKWNGKIRELEKGIILLEREFDYPTKEEIDKQRIETEKHLIKLKESFADGIFEKRQKIANLKKLKKHHQEILDKTNKSVGN